MKAAGVFCLWMSARRSLLTDSICWRRSEIAPERLNAERGSVAALLSEDEDESEEEDDEADAEVEGEVEDPSGGGVEEPKETGLTPSAELAELEDKELLEVEDDELLALLAAFCLASRKLLYR